MDDSLIANEVIDSMVKKKERGIDRESTQEDKEEIIILEARHKQPSWTVYSRRIKGTCGRNEEGSTGGCNNNL